MGCKLVFLTATGCLRHTFNSTSSTSRSNCQIFVAKYDIFDYSAGEPDSKFLTILRALKVDSCHFMDGMVESPN